MEKQANSRSCFVCGVENPIGLHLKFYFTSPEEVAASFTASQEYQSYPGVLHGGIIAALLDETGGRVHLHGYPPRFMYTAKLEIRFRKNVPIGQPLTIIGRAGKTRSRMAESWAGIFAADGSLLAEANALYVDVPQPPDASALDDFGWKVYPDAQGSD